MTIVTWTRFLFIFCLLIFYVAAKRSEQDDYDDESVPTCPQIEYSLHNGEIIYTDDPRSVGVSAFFVCNETFDLFPSAQMETICQPNREWDLKKEDFPDCLQRAAVPHVKDGTVYRYAPYRKGLRPGFDARHNQSVVVQCDPDRRAFRDVYLDNEDDRVSTNNNGTWVPKIAECVPEPCDVRKVLGNHVMSYKNESIAGRLIPHGETVTISCMDDHELTSQTPFVKRKCSYGKMRIPQCFPKSCSEPSRTSNPYLHLSDRFNIGPWFEHGVKAVASCHPRTDYEVFVDTTNEFTDSYITTCNFGNWSVIHGCVERHCVLPSSSDIIFEPSVYYKRIDGEVVASGTTINMSCTEGYTLTDEHLHSYHHSIQNKCYKGKWNLTVSCEPDPCHLPDLQDEVVFTENTESQNVAHAAVITMSCKHGYQMYLGTRQVQEDQVRMICWLGVLVNPLNNDTSLPECRPMACQLNNKPGTSFYVNGTEVPGETTVASDTRFYVVCHDGFRRVNEFGRKTSINSTICVRGRLSNDINCQEIECSLSSANNTMTDTKIVLPGREVSVVCSPGFEMRVGGSFFERHRFLCKKGTFHPTFPVCVEKRCEVISTEFTRHNPGDTWIPSKSSVTISCQDGYELQNGSRYVNLEEMNMTCSRGKFDISPVCKPILLCEPLCLENGGQCTITGQCLCSTGRMGANCDLVEYRIALERGWFAGTFGTVWIEVIGARDSFKQELTGVYNTFGKRLKLRYTLKGIYVGEISNVLITTSQSVVPNVGYVAIYSSEDRKYYRFEAGNKRRSVCEFQRRDGTPWTYGHTKYLRPAENAEECQLSCVAENGCVLARFDKRTKITTSADLRHTCIAFLWGYNLVTAQTAGVEIYLKYCN